MVNRFSFKSYLRKTRLLEPKKDFRCVCRFKEKHSYSRLHEMKKKSLLLIAYWLKILQDFSIFKNHFDNFFEGERWKIKEEYLTFLYLHSEHNEYFFVA